jgi:hypothetical protein
MPSGSPSSFSLPLSLPLYIHITLLPNLAYYPEDWCSIFLRNVVKLPAISPYLNLLYSDRCVNPKSNIFFIFRKIPPFVWLSCCWSNESTGPDHQGRSVRYAHTNTDTSNVTETFTSSTRRLNTIHSSTARTANVPLVRHVQLRTPPANSTNTNVHSIQTDTSIL